MTRAEFDRVRGDPLTSNGDGATTPSEPGSRSCPQCGRDIVGDRRRIYCSPRCAKKAKLGRERARRPAVVKNPTALTPPTCREDRDGLVPFVEQLLALDVVAEVVVERDGWRLLVH